MTASFCVAAGAFLLAQNLRVLDQRRNWLVSQPANGAHWLLPASSLGAAAIAIALLIAPVLPGAGRDPLLNFTSAGRNRTGGRSYRPLLAPFVDIGDKLDQAKNVELFTVSAAIADYWRIAALDQYSSENGGRWTLSAEGNGSVKVGLPRGTPDGALVQQFRIGKLGERWLPAAYRPVAISLPDTLEVSSSGTIVTDASTASNLEYTVASKLPPLAGTVDRQQQQATAVPVPRDLLPYTALPSSPDIDTIRNDARSVTAGATNPYAQAEKLRDYFRSPASDFVYDASVDPGDNSGAIVAFLRNKRGFCVQFASAYAVMARSLGIPARVAVGFTPGTRGRDGIFHVSSRDAHAWPEIWLAGLGWTHLFDPTPASGGNTAGGSRLPNEPAVAGQQTPGTPATTVAPATTIAPSSRSGGTNPPASSPAGAAVRPNVTAASPDNGIGLWLPVLGSLLALTLLVAVYITVVLTAKARRRAHRREATSPSAAITGAWEEALDRLREADLVSDPALTPIELARTALTGPTPTTTQPLRRLARVYTAARYGEGAVGPDDALGAWTSFDEIEEALERGLSWRQRWRRRLDPTNLR
jgi:transglutaminase-like putative cysteine protease